MNRWIRRLALVGLVLLALAAALAVPALEWQAERVLLSETQARGVSLEWRTLSARVFLTPSLVLEGVSVDWPERGLRGRAERIVLYPKLDAIPESARDAVARAEVSGALASIGGREVRLERAFVFATGEMSGRGTLAWPEATGGGIGFVASGKLGDTFVLSGVDGRPLVDSPQMTVPMVRWDPRGGIEVWKPRFRYGPLEITPDVLSWDSGIGTLSGGGIRWGVEAGAPPTWRDLAGFAGGDDGDEDEHEHEHEHERHLHAIHLEDVRVTLPGLPEVLVSGAARFGEVEILARSDFGRASLQADWPQLTHVNVRARELDPGALVVGGEPGWQAGGKVDIDLDAISDEDGGWLALARLRVRDASLAHPGIADSPIVGLAVDAHAEIAWSRAADTLEVRDAVVTAGPVRARLRLEASELLGGERGGLPEISIQATLDPIDCQALWDLTPDALVGAYRHAEFEGTVSLSLNLSLPFSDLFGLEFRLDGFEDACSVRALNLAPEGYPPVTVVSAEPQRKDLLSDVEWLNLPFVREITYAETPVTVGPGRDDYVVLAKLPAWLRAVTYLSEDAGFFEGRAIDLRLIKRALRFNLSRNRFVYGGSTLPQQLAKNLFLDRRKSLARKLQEAVVAARMHEVVTRERMLELYLNCIEFAPDVYGVAAASRYYFEKSPSELTPMESVFLARMKPDPGYGAGIKARGRTPETETWARPNRRLFDRLVAAGIVEPAVAAAAEPYLLRWDEGGRYIP